MGFYKLLCGQHTQAHEGPDAEQDVAGKKQKTYKAGEFVPSDVDLAAKFGADRFQYVGDTLERAQATLPPPAPDDTTAHAKQERNRRRAEAAG